MSKSNPNFKYISNFTQYGSSTSTSGKVCSKCTKWYKPDINGSFCCNRKQAVKLNDNKIYNDDPSGKELLHIISTSNVIRDPYFELLQTLLFYESDYIVPCNISDFNNCIISNENIKATIIILL
eukprot:Pgem_evm1s955